MQWKHGHLQWELHGQFSDGCTAPVQAVGRERPLEAPKTQIVILVLVHFGLIK